MKRNTKYYGIIFDWTFKTPTQTCPGPLMDSWQHFQGGMKQTYNYVSNNIIVSKKYSDSIVGTLIEFKNCIASMPQLVSAMDITQMEIIEISKLGDMREMSLR